MSEEDIGNPHGDEESEDGSLALKIKHYIHLRYPVSEISILLGIPLRTLRRRMSAAGISVRGAYTHLRAQQLESVVRQVLLENPLLGEVMVWNRLFAMGIRVRREQVRQAMHSVVGHRRLPPAIARRRYSVRAPLSVIHIDGNHKLIRYHVVVHGGIDGFSRLIFFLKVSNNNKASTVLNAFLEGARTFGVPSRVRSDKGGENVLVGYFMVAARGLDRGSFLTGKSVHNQRVERLWRDVFRCVLSVFYRLFREMEEDNVLNPDDDVDIFCLHIVYLPLIQKLLEEFIKTWNLHGLSSLRGRPSPLRLFEMGLHVLRERSERLGTTYTELIQDLPLGHYVPERLEQLLRCAEFPSVHVPDLAIPLNDQERQRIENLSPGDSLRLIDARQLYMACRNLARSILARRRNL